MATTHRTAQRRSLQGAFVIRKRVTVHSIKNRAARCDYLEVPRDQRSWAGGRGMARWLLSFDQRTVTLNLDTLFAYFYFPLLCELWDVRCTR